MSGTPPQPPQFLLEDTGPNVSRHSLYTQGPRHRVSGKGTAPREGNRDVVRCHPPTGRSREREEVPSATKTLLRAAREHLLYQFFDHK